MVKIDLKQKQQQADQLYKQYGQSLEHDHLGEYLAISPGGQTIIGSDLMEVLKKAKRDIGPGTFIFKVGEKAVYKWR